MKNHLLIIELKNKILEIEKVNTHYLKQLEEATNCLEVAESKILELERKLRFAENQLKGQIQGTENLTEENKKLKSDYMHVCENYKQKDLQCEKLIAENKNLIKTNTIWAQQISNYESTSKTLLEENRKLKIDLEARPPIWANANLPEESWINNLLTKAYNGSLPKISDSTLERLILIYRNSKKMHQNLLIVGCLNVLAILFF